MSHLRPAAPLLLFITMLVVLPARAQTFEPVEFEVEIVETIAAERGEITVPENRSASDSRMIPIRFLRFESRAETPGAPIIYLAGGPGGSGTAAASGQRWKLFDRLRDVADVIILDQRGTGLSDDLPGCESSVALPADSATTRGLYVRRHRAALQECLAFWEGEGVDLRGYTTWESAADIDAVREALGADRVSLLGISYGTHLALATLKRYPDHVDRLVLASAEGLDQTVKLPSRTDAYFERLQAAIDADSAAHALYPNVRSLIERVLDQVEASPPTLEIPEGRNNPAFRHTMGRFELQLITGYLLSDPDDAASILEGYARAAEGDYRWFRRFFDWTYDGPTLSFGGMPQAMDLASGISPERLARVQEEAETALLGDALNFPMPHLRGTIPGIDLGEDFRAPVVSNRPALFFSGTLDGRTYPEAHAEIAEGFANGAVVTIEHAGHNLFFSHSDVVELIAAFLDGAPAEVRTLTAPRPRFVD
jgi:pimeloyl-ACP methyl ester carboxylesterase